jgi:uncharacterized protein YeaO (DUF488 family)
MTKKSKKHSLKVKRVYEVASKDDGTRILVDRLWPRGIKKDALKLDFWLKEASPSTKETPISLRLSMGN